MKLYSSKIFILVVSILVSFNLLISSQIIEASSADNVKFETITVKEGLSNNTVYSIIQDSYGYLWFATADGLNKYTGAKFITYRYNPLDPKSLSGNLVRTIYEDSNGIIWIGTDNGLSKYSRETDSFIQYISDPNDNNSLSDQIVFSICEDNNLNLWIGTTIGLNKYNKKTDSFTHYFNNPNDPNSISNNFIYTIYLDTKGNLWIGTKNGLNMYNWQTNSFTNYFYDPNDSNSISHNTVTSLYEDTKGNLWIGTNNGLNKYNINTNIFTRYYNDQSDIFSLSDNAIRALFQDCKSNLWIGTANGLNILNTDTEMISRYFYNPNSSYGISAQSITALFQDNSNILWVGTTGGGICKYDYRNDAFINYRHNFYDSNSLSNNSVLSIGEDSNYNLWIGTGNGLNKYNRETNSFTQYFNDPDNPNSISSDFICCVYIDSKDNLWIGTNNGLNRYHNRTDSFTRYFYDNDDSNSLSNNFCRVILEDSEGVLWIGTAAGLNRYDPMTETFVNYFYDVNNLNSISYNTVSYLYEDTKGNLWIGTSNGGLNKYDRENDSFIRYFYDADDANRLSSNVIRVISEDSNGILWIGTYYGLNSYDEDTGKIVTYTTENGLVNNTINGILEDETGYLWISTTGGLSMFNSANQIFINYGIRNSFYTAEFIEQACFKSKTGELLFGSTNGLYSIYPNDVETNTNPTHVLITGFYINGGYIETDKPIEDVNTVALLSNDNSFTIEFAALDYISPNSIRYTYVLEGFDKNWQYCNADRNFAVYTNIPSGEYTFIVKAVNSDGIWTQKETSLTIIIKAPYWKQWWFILFSVFIGLGLIYLVIKYITYNVSKRAQKLEYQVEERTKMLKVKSEALENELNKRAEFSRFLVHELKTPLTSLQITNDILLSQSQTQPFTSLAEGINKDITSLSHRIEELLDISRGEIGLLKLKRREVHLNKFFAILKRDLTLFVEAEGKKLEFLMSEELPVVLIDKERIVQVIYNLVDNALKFTFRNGIIAISVDIIDNSLIVQVSDNGQGISIENVKNIFEDSHHQTNTDKRHGGFGLGLSLSKLLIELHGGHIWVDSELDKGSTFGFSIPVNDL